VQKILTSCIYLCTYLLFLPLVLTLFFLAVAEAVDDAAGDGEEFAELVAEVLEDDLWGEADGEVGGAVEVDGAAGDADGAVAIGVEAGGGEKDVRGQAGIAVIEGAVVDTGESVEVDASIMIAAEMVLNAAHADDLGGERAGLDAGIGGLRGGKDGGAAGGVTEVPGDAEFWGDPVGGHGFTAAQVVALGEVLAGLTIEEVSTAEDFKFFGVGDRGRRFEDIFLGLKQERRGCKEHSENGKAAGGGCGAGAASCTDATCGRGQPGAVTPGADLKHGPPNGSAVAAPDLKP